MTWAQIIVIGFFILMSILTVAICDITIIRGIEKFTKILTELVVLLRKKIKRKGRK